MLNTAYNALFHPRFEIFFLYDIVIVNFLLSTGIRQNSLINIKIKDVDFDNDIVYINTTKNRKSLIIPLNEDIVKILQEYLKYRGGGADDWLFCSIYGEKMTKGANYTALWDYSGACYTAMFLKSGYRFLY